MLTLQKPPPDAPNAQNESSFDQRTATHTSVATSDRDDGEPEIGAHGSESRSDVGQTEENDEDDAGEYIDWEVQDDMRKLDESFPGISQQFRLVNRIGEGKYTCGIFRECTPVNLTYFRYLLNGVQGRRPPV